MFKSISWERKGWPPAVISNARCSSEYVPPHPDGHAPPSPSSEETPPSWLRSIALNFLPGEHEKVDNKRGRRCIYCIFLTWFWSSFLAIVSCLIVLSRAERLCSAMSALRMPKAMLLS